MKKYFLTGLALILPLVLTFLIVNFVVSFLTNPFLNLTHYILTSTGLIVNPFILVLVSKILILLFIIGTVLLIGMMGQWFIIDRFFKWGDQFLEKIPFVRKIYRVSKEMTHTFTGNSPAFKEAVLCPFPSSKSLAIAFVTSGKLNIPNKEDLVPLFIPTPPNPLMGVLIMVKREKLIPLNMPIDQTIKFVASCGLTR